MIDNRTTELLPCPWCGVDMKLHAINYPWADGEPGWNIWHEDMGEAGKRKCPMEMGCYDTREEAVEAWNTRAELGSGTLTAEQVEKAIHDCSTYASYDGCTYYASGIRLQAIADELNAELGSGTCEWILEHSGTLYDKWRCSKCGYLFVESRTDQHKHPADFDPNFCPNCGARVKAVKR